MQHVGDGRDVAAVHLEAVADLDVLDLIKAELFLEDVAVKVFILHVQRLFVDDSA